jgi:hypothetical protein
VPPSTGRAEQNATTRSVRCSKPFTACLSTGPRGPDKFPRKKRATTLFNFFETIRGIERRQADENVPMTPQQTRKEFCALSRPQRSYWEYMHELFFVFERQQNAAEAGSVSDPTAHRKKQRLWHKFYFLEETQQRQLVRKQRQHPAHLGSNVN